MDLAHDSVRTYSEEHFGARVRRKGKRRCSKPVTTTAPVRLPAIPYSNAAILCRETESRHKIPPRNDMVFVTNS